MKAIYGCKLVVFGNALLCDMLRYCEFVDERVDIGSLSFESLSQINAHHCDYLVLTNARTAFIKVAQQSNAKCIIAPLKTPSLLAKGVRCLPLGAFLRYRRSSESERSLLLARCIHPTLFDRKIATLDWSKAHIKAAQKHHDFIQSKLVNIAGRKILINPFSHTCAHSLSIQGWLRLIAKVQEIPSLQPIVMTYPSAHEAFMEAKEAFERSFTPLPRLRIIANGDDVLYLAALIECMDCVISTSTGTIHLASNLQIPSIGLYPKKDMLRWETHNRVYVEVSAPRECLSEAQEALIISRTLAKLEEML